MNTAILRTIVACCLAMMMIMFSRTDVSAQGVPQAMNYQAAVRDSLGLPLADKDIGVRISILRGSSSGEPVYVEQHHVRTDDLGLFVVAIGRGESKSGAFGAVDWSARDYWLKIDVDVHGGTDFIELGAQQLYSVPFALMAERSRYSDTAKVALRSLGPAGSDGDSLAWKIGGNRGIDPEHNFIGTADSADFIVRTNGKIRFIIGADGSFHVGDLRPVETNMVVVSDDSQGGTLGSRPLIDLIDMAVLRKLDSMLFADPLFIHHIISRLNIDLAHDSVFIREVTSDSLFVSRLHHTINSLLLKDSSFITSLTRHLETLIRRDTMRVETIVRGLDTLLSRDSVFIARLTSDSTFIERLETIGERFFWSLTGSTGTDPSRNFLGTRDSRPLAIRTDNVERMRVDGNGNVGIGTVAPTERLHVAGNIRSEGLAGGDRRLMVAQPDGRMAAPGYVGDVILPQIDTALANDPTFVTSLTNNNTFITNVQGLGDSSYWSLTGSAGLDPSRNFLGTTDNSPLALRTNDVERMRVDATGNVGIGTATPEEKLHVAGDIKVDGLSGPAPRLMVAGVDGKLGASSDVGPIIVPQIDTVLANDPTFVTSLTTSGTFINRVKIIGDSSYWSLTGSAGTDPSQNFLGTTDNSPLALRTNDVERMRVDATGNVGIGTATPEEKLHVAGDIKVDGLSGPAPRLMVAGVDGKLGASSDVGSIIVSQIDTVLANDPTFVNAIITSDLFATNLRMVGDTMFWALDGSAGLDPSRNFLGTTDNSPLALRTGDVERLRIDATGNVGIGTATPGERLHLSDGNVLISNTTNTAGELRLQEPSGSGSNYIALRAPSLASNVVFTLPASLGTANTILTSDGAGGLSWTDPSVLVGSSIWGVGGNTGLTNPNFGTLDDQPINFITGSGGPNVRLRIDANGNVGIGTTAPQHRLHVVNDSTGDELAAVYGVATQSATDQAIGLWGDASGTDAGNTGTIGVLATGNGSTSVGATNAAIQINDGEIRVGRTTETGTGYTPVEGAAAGISYTAEGPSGVIEVANLGGLLGTLGIGQSLILNHMPVNNRYVKPNSIILLQVINASGLTLGNLLNLTFSTLVDDRTDGSFMVSVSAHYAGLLPLVLGVTDAVRIGYVVINPAQ